MTAFAKLPCMNAAYRSLGRPMPPVVLEHPLAVESVCARLLAALGKAPVICVGGPASAEGPLLAGAATLASRLRRSGRTVEIRGEVLETVLAPPLPQADVAILIEAPFYADLSGWTQPEAGRAVFLFGQDSEWSRAGVQPDIALPAFPEIDLRQYRKQWRTLASAGKREAFAAALGCDLVSAEPELHDVHFASTMLSSGQKSINTGVWLAREELSALVRYDNRFAASVRELSGEGQRFERAIQLWEETCRIGL